MLRKVYISTTTHDNCLTQTTVFIRHWINSSKFYDARYLCNKSDCDRLENLLQDKQAHLYLNKFSLTIEYII